MEVRLQTRGTGAEAEFLEGVPVGRDVGGPRSGQDHSRTEWELLN